jgi:hypothetical protein
MKHLTTGSLPVESLCDGRNSVGLIIYIIYCQFDDAYNSLDYIASNGKIGRVLRETVATYLRLYPAPTFGLGETRKRYSENLSEYRDLKLCCSNTNQVS